jgi:chromosome partitioning protein
MKRIVVANNKGGIGKTTSVQNISSYLAMKGYKVLMLDLDPQTNLTDCFGVFESKKTIYDSFSKNIPLPVIKIRENLFLVPSSLDFAGIEPEILAKLQREYILAKLLEPLENQYDYCVMDCPPSLGLITVNALTAGDAVLIPLEAEYLAYRGIDTIMDLIGSIKETINGKLYIAGVFFTKYNPRRSLTTSIKAEVEKHCGKTILNSVVRVNVALAECQSNGQDIFTYDKESNGAKDYQALVEEILSKHIN